MYVNFCQKMQLWLHMCFLAAACFALCKMCHHWYVSFWQQAFFFFFLMFWGFICLQRLECRMYLWWKISLEVSVVISAKSGISADGGCFLCSCPWTIFMLPEEVKLVFSVYRLAKGLPSADLWAEKLFFCIWDCVEYLRAEILVGDLVRTSCSSENFWQSELFFG